MKKLIIAALATSLLATPVIAAPYQGGDNRGRVEQRHSDRGPHYGKHDYRGWKKGDRFDQRRAQYYQVIKNPRAYRLANAPRGYQWVRSGNDAVLVAYKGNRIADVKYGIFRR